MIPYFIHAFNLNNFQKSISSVIKKFLFKKIFIQKNFLFGIIEVQKYNPFLNKWR
jgi:hypothetical protein